MTSKNSIQEFYLTTRDKQKVHELSADTVAILLKELEPEFKILNKKIQNDPKLHQLFKSAAPSIKLLNNFVVADNNAEEKEEPFEPFDWALYSALIRKARKEQGFKTAESFSKAIYRHTRVNVSRDSVYKIEQGKQVPDPIQFFGINITLYSEPLPKQIVDLCFNNELASVIEDDGSIPTEWAIENYWAEVGDRPHDGSISENDLAYETNDWPSVFKNPKVKPNNNDNQYFIDDEDIPF